MERGDQGLVTARFQRANPRRETGERDATQALREQRLGIVEKLIECSSHCSLNPTAFGRRAGTRDIDALKQSLAECSVYVAERDVGRVPCERPPAAGAARRSHDAGLA